MVRAIWHLCWHPEFMCSIRKLFSLGCVIVLPFASPVWAEELSAAHVIQKLDLLKTNIAAELTLRLSTNVVPGTYTTVWRQFEELVVVGLREVLPRHIPELTAKHFDAGESGREKNRMADFAIVCGTNTIEISIKSARNTGQPENDLGTFRDYENRRRQFVASFAVFVRYEDRGETLRGERVFFDRSWRLVGKSTLVDGVKYRKKDGNMRPKSWRLFESGTAFWESEADFEAAVKRSATFRANELVKEYLDDLSEEDQRLLHERLHEKFVMPANP
jgi:hypothetical protein